MQRYKYVIILNLNELIKINFSNTINIENINRYNQHKWKLLEGGPQSFIKMLKDPMSKRNFVWLY